MLTHDLEIVPMSAAVLSFPAEDEATVYHTSQLASIGDWQESHLICQDDII